MEGVWWLFALLGEDVKKGSRNSTLLLAQWEQVHMTENAIVPCSATSMPVCSVWVRVSPGNAQAGAVGTVIGMRTGVSLDSGKRGPWTLRAIPVTQPAHSEQTVEGPHLGRLSDLEEEGWGRLKSTVIGINKGPEVSSVWTNL